jgi:hypothetical protein
MIEPDFSAMDRERVRPERERELINEIHKLKYLEKCYAKATISAEEMLVEVNRSKEDLESQEKLVRELIKGL